LLNLLRRKNSIINNFYTEVGTKKAIKVLGLRHLDRW